MKKVKNIVILFIVAIGVITGLVYYSWGYGARKEGLELKSE